MDVLSKATNAKYINRYIDKNGYTELHITNLKDYDIVLKLDNEDVNKIKKYFWCCSMVGREGYETPCIYCYIKKVHTLLTRILLDVKKEQKVIFKNGDNLDFRKENLHIVNPKESFIRNNNNKKLPTGIFERVQKNGNNTGYIVCYFDNNIKKVKYFGIRKYQTLENCLKMAIQFKKDSLVLENVL